MKILFFTIVLDGMPYLPLIYASLRNLPKEIEWTWFCMEGVANSLHCTKWVRQMEPRLSMDGTHEYLLALEKFDRRVIPIFKPSWRGKIEQVNWPLSTLQRDPRDLLLWQIDSDEYWRTHQIVRMHQMFEESPDKNAAFFWCRYFVGPDKVITTRNCFGNHPEYEWHRVWKIKPGMLFRTHEPPVISGLTLNPFRHAETEANGLVFDHFAYSTREQVAFKQQYYAGQNNPNAAAYSGLADRWEQFQDETQWPRSLKEVMPWAEAGCMVDRV